MKADGTVHTDHTGHTNCAVRTDDTMRAVCRETEIRTVVVGTGAAGYAAALRLYQSGERELAVAAEAVHAGTSRNAGSDKQTYYKLSLSGQDMDSAAAMAQDLFSGRCVDGDLALCEAALSARCFYRLEELGVPFPENEYGESVGYKTDHDRGRRASSAGPYTSRMMTECLEREVRERGIRVMDGLQVIRILVHENRLCGILCLDRNAGGRDAFLIIWCRYLVLATGGPAGMYRDSVYPLSQRGSSGMAFEAGIRGKNLTEWQFGMASLRPRWNVSGTYMQVLPRFVSTDERGADEREFLSDYFEDPAQLLYLVFLKGYQWPFDSRRIFGGSSLIDLLVYQETVLKGRRVWLDYTKNPCGGEIDYDRLPSEAGDYLRSAGACFGTPVQRLERMNEPAILFYREHGVDLYRERLEIAVCVQHNNGGLAADADWQTCVEGIYAVGEVCGSHGVSRPGGSALNAGQVGALRAAGHIGRMVRLGRIRAAASEEERSICRQQALQRMRLLRAAQAGLDAEGIRERAQRRMSRAGGLLRSEEVLEEALRETVLERGRLDEAAAAGPLRETDVPVMHGQPGKAGGLFGVYDMLLSQQVYLTAMLDYVRRGGGSRGSCLYTDPDGAGAGEGLPEQFCCRPDREELGGLIQEIWLKGGECGVEWRPVRPLPEPDSFFENQWRAFREREGHIYTAT